MEELLGVIRRLILAIVWLGGILISIMLFIVGFNDDFIFVWVGIGVLFLTWITSIIINWIFGERS